MHEVNASAYRQKICGIVVLDCGLVFWHTHSRRCFFKLSGQVDWPVRNVKLLFTKLFSEAHPLPHFATSSTSSLLPGAKIQTKTGRIRNVSGQTLISGPTLGEIDSIGRHPDCLDHSGLKLNFHAAARAKKDNILIRQQSRA